MILILYLLVGCVYMFINGVSGDAACYNHDYSEVKFCDFGCCGSDEKLECCLHGRLIPYMVAGAMFLVILAIAIFLICYRKREDLKRILNAASRRDIINERILSLNNTTMVRNNSRLCTPTLTTAPPPYIGPPPPYTEVQAPQDNIELTSLNMQQVTKPYRESHASRTQYEYCNTQTPQILQDSRGLPPPYGINAENSHTNYSRT